MSEKSFKERFDNIEKVLDLKFGGIRYETIKANHDHEQSMKAVEKEELAVGIIEETRFIEVKIFDERQESVFKVSGWVTREMSHRFIEQIGCGFVPVTPMAHPRALAPSRTSCKHRSDCVETYEKCTECGNNTAKSYFKPKTET